MRKICWVHVLTSSHHSQPPPMHKPPIWSPSTVIHQNCLALRNKTNTSVPPSFLTIKDGTTVVNYRINKRIPKALSLVAWQMRKHMALGQEGASHPGWITSSLLGTIYLMQMKNQTFINQLNKKLRGRVSRTWKKQILFLMELEDWKSIRTWDMHTSGVCCESLSHLVKPWPVWGFVYGPGSIAIGKPLPSFEKNILELSVLPPK